MPSPSNVREQIARAIYEAPIDGDSRVWPPEHPDDLRFWLERADAVLARFNVIPKRKIVSYRDVQVQYDDGSWSREYRREPIFEGDTA